TIGRGPTLAIAREAALKLKEACNLHAEAFSGAEFMHGPVALISDLYPLLMFMPADDAAEGLAALAADLTRNGAAVLVPGPARSGRGPLPALPPVHPDADAFGLIKPLSASTAGLAARRAPSVAQPPPRPKVTRRR